MKEFGGEAGSSAEMKAAKRINIQIPARNFFIILVLHYSYDRWKKPTVIFVIMRDIPLVQYLVGR